MYSKITVSNNFMEIQMGGGVFKLGNPEWRGAQAVLEIQVDGGSKNRAFRRGGVNFFWNNPLQVSFKFKFQVSSFKFIKKNFLFVKEKEIGRKYLNFR